MTGAARWWDFGIFLEWEVSGVRGPWIRPRWASGGGHVKGRTKIYGPSGARAANRKIRTLSSWTVQALSFAAIKNVKEQIIQLNSLHTLILILKKWFSPDARQIGVGKMFLTSYDYTLLLYYLLLQYYKYTPIPSPPTRAALNLIYEKLKKLMRCWKR